MPECVVNIWRDRVAPAVDQHCSNGAVVAGEHRANAGIDRVAQALHEGVGTLQRSLGSGRRKHLYRAADKAGRADALEKQIARKIVTAGLERLQRRLKRCFDFNERSRRWRHAALDRKPHAPRLVFEARAIKAIDAQHEAVGVPALLAQFDKAGDGHAGRRKVQHRMADQRGLKRRDRKSQGDAEHPKRHHMRHDLPAQKYRAEPAECGDRYCRPQRRLAFGREIENDAGAIGDGKPRQQPAGG